MLLRIGISKENSERKKLNLFYIIYRLQKNGDGDAEHWRFQSIGTAQGAVSAARAVLGVL